MEDAEAWLEYPKHRWVYNKLELALTLGYDAGPACVPVRKSGIYIIRPTYNLYGMGVGATIRYIDITDGLDMSNHAIVPPGFFWCEAFHGTHYSTDYVNDGKRWTAMCTMVGENDPNLLTKFTKWTKIKNRRVKLPQFVNQFMDVPVINIESIGDKIIEIHLRSGNDVMYNEAIGTTLIPVWEDDENNTVDITNEDTESRYDASGNLQHVRLGYRYER